MSCLEVKRYPDGRRVTFACELLAIEPARQLVDYTIRRAVTVAGVFLPAGTRSYGCFWAGRHYNLYLWMRPCGARRRTAVLGAYFNVCDAVELGRAEVRWRDLWVDVLALPARPPLTLDRDEVPGGLPPPLARRIEDATAELHARSGELVQECLRWAGAARPHRG